MSEQVEQEVAPTLLQQQEAAAVKVPDVEAPAAVDGDDAVLRRAMALLSNDINGGLPKG